MFATLTEAEMTELARTVHRGYLKARNQAPWELDAHDSAALSNTALDLEATLNDVSYAFWAARAARAA